MECEFAIFLKWFWFTLSHHTSLAILPLAVFPVIQAVVVTGKTSCGSSGSMLVALNPLTVLVTQVRFA
jgi:hypothetical protein